MCMKKGKEEFVDDGRTVANMDVEGFAWHKTEKQKKRKKEVDDLKISRREKWAIIKGAYLAYLPVFLVCILAFTIVMLLITLWAS